MSDQDEGRAVWPDATGTMGWEIPANLGGQPGELDDPDAEEADLQTPDTEGDLPGWTRQPLINKDSLKTFARQFSPILIPLVCAALIFLVTLPASQQGLPAHPSVLITGILLLVIAIIQGSLLYFAGSNDTLWFVWIACGCALFFVSGVFVAFGAVATLIVFVVLFVLGGLLVRRCMHATNEGYVDVIGSFGKYAHTLYPGLNLLLPWEKVLVRLSTQEITWVCPLQRVPTSRDQDVQLTATFSYQLLPDDAYLAALTVNEWENSLRLLFIGTIQSVINELSPSDFVAWTQSIYAPHAENDSISFNPAAATRWDRINGALARRMQDQAATWGVQVNWVRIQDITVLPHTLGDFTALLDNDTTQITLLSPPPAQLASARRPVVLPTPVEVAAPAPAPVPARARPEPMRTPAQLDALRNMYDAVRKGIVNDPTTILDLADRFESVANDPAASKAIDFDAARGAETLRQRAHKLQELAQGQTRVLAEGSQKVAEGSLIEKG